MKKEIPIILMFLLVLPCVLAINLEVEKTSSGEVLIPQLGKSVTFDLAITNNGAGDDFEFYNLLGFEMFPVGTVHINGGQTKIVQVEIYPLSELTFRGNYKFTYFIKGGDKSSVEEDVIFKIIDLKDAFEVGAEEIDPNSNKILVYLRNKENLDFETVDVEFSSAFFDFEESFNLGPKERKSFEVQLNKEDFKQLSAGFYTLTAKMKVYGKETIVEDSIKFVEEQILETTEDAHGFFILTKVIKKTNKGNTAVSQEIVLKKNIISRLFTSFSPEPDIAERDGLVMYYIWDRNIKPGEVLEISSRTNWLLPFLVVLFIVAIVVLAKQYSGTNLFLRKKVSFVKAKGGEFALKISIFIKAKKYVERVNVVDRLPPLVKIYERFGENQPTKVDEKNRRIEWSFGKLEAGEIRMVSYMIYSKIGVLGRFVLPSATAFFERNGKFHEAQSNQAFFMAEQRKKELEDE